MLAVTPLHIRPAAAHDRAAVLDLLNHARRSFTAFGAEDLSGLLGQGDCHLAVADNGLACGFLCLTLNRTGWATLRGLVLRDGWRADPLLDTLLPPALARLRAWGIDHLVVYGTELWLLPVLQRAGFTRVEWIITLEQALHLPAPVVAPASLLRPVQPDDLAALTALDAAAFTAPYQLSSGELIELMVTSGHFAVAANPAVGLVGYVCADVVGADAQVIRLAVHPAAQRRGLGQALLDQALRYCRQNGARRVTINTQESNAASLRLYERNGFRRMGRRVPLLVRVV